MGLPVWLEGSTIPDTVLCAACGHAANEHDADGWCQYITDGGCDDPECCEPSTCLCHRTEEMPSGVG